MILLFCGVIIGAVMGLTGSGGALIAIPLFIQFLGMELKDASVYSLLAVALASLVNFVPQRKNTQYGMAILLILFSFVGSYLSFPYKIFASEFLVALIIFSVSLYALYSIWTFNTSDQASASPSKHNLLKGIVVGLGLGVITTFSGLGGGVLLMPVFLNFFHFGLSSSLGTSLLTVGFSSLISLFLQTYHGVGPTLNTDIGFLLAGMMVANLLLKYLIKKISFGNMVLIRKVVFTLVVILAVIKIV